MDNEEQTESSKKKAEQYLDTIFDSSLVEIKCSFQALKKSERLIVLHSSGDVKSFIMISCLNKDCAANILSHIGLENKNAVAFFCTMPLGKVLNCYKDMIQNQKKYPIYILSFVQTTALQKNFHKALHTFSIFVLKN